MKLIRLRSGSPRLAAHVLTLLLGAGPLAVAQQYTISTVAGGTPPATPTAATSISVGPPRRVATGAAGNLYFTSSHCVFKVDASGTLTLIAGNSRAGFAGDGGPATQAQLDTPQGLAIDAAGDVFIADTANNRIREVTPDGNIQTIAGTGTAGFAGNGGPATQALLHAPGGVAVDANGNVYIADSGNHSIRKLTPDGTLSQFAGVSYPGFSGDTGQALGANLFGPQDVAVAASGSIYIVDTGNARIRTVGGDGVINTVVGAGTIGISGDGGAATSASLSVPYAVAVNSAGNIYIADFGNNRIRMVDPKGTITTVVGTGIPGFSGDGAAATKANLNLPTGVALDSSGNLYIADQWNQRIRKLATSGNITTAAGNGLVSYSGDGGSATRAQLNGPQSVAVDPTGNLYIADTRNAVIREVSPTGAISTLAGTSLTYPRGLATDASGNVYVADYQDNKVKKIAPDGTVTTIAGNGSVGYSGDGGPASSALLNGPYGLALDRAGNLFIADFGNNVIREVSTSGVITTVAGSGIQSYSGDGQPAAQAGLNGPFGVAVDAGGNLYIADTNNNVVRKVTTDGVIRTFAGTGLPGYTGDGGPPLQAQIIAPAGIAVDSTGNVYISDSAMRIRKIYQGSLIATIAGDGIPGYSGDSGIATLAAMNGPAGIALDGAGNLYVADTGNNAIRRLQPGASTITLQSVTNGASNQSGAVAPGEIVVLNGSGLGPAQLTLYQAVNGKVGTALAGTSVSFNGIAAPIIYTSPAQVAAIVPFGVSGSSVQVVASYLGQSTAAKTVAGAPSAPGVFTVDYSGKGQAAAVNQNQQPNSSASPAKIGQTLTLYTTGLGQTSPPGADGLLGTAPLPSAGQPPAVTIGGQNAQVTSATGVLGQVAGMMQVTVVVPAGAQPGNAVAVTLQVAGGSAPSGVTVAISN